MTESPKLPELTFTVSGDRLVLLDLLSTDDEAADSGDDGDEGDEDVDEGRGEDDDEEDPVDGDDGDEGDGGGGTTILLAKSVTPLSIRDTVS